MLAVAQHLLVIPGRHLPRSVLLIERRLVLKVIRIRMAHNRAQTLDPKDVNR